MESLFIGLGGLITAIASLAVSAHYARRRAVRDAYEQDEEATRRIATEVCHSSSARYQAEQRESLRRVFDRLDQLGREISEIRGSLSGGLEAALTRAVRAALDEREP